MWQYGAGSPIASCGLFAGRGMLGLLKGELIGARLKILFFNTLFEWINASGVFIFYFI